MTHPDFRAAEGCLVNGPLLGLLEWAVIVLVVMVLL